MSHHLWFLLCVLQLVNRVLEQDLNISHSSQASELLRSTIHLHVHSHEPKSINTQINI